MREFRLSRGQLCAAVRHALIESNQADRGDLVVVDLPLDAEVIGRVVVVPGSGDVADYQVVRQAVEAPQDGEGDH